MEKETKYKLTIEASNENELLEALLAKKMSSLLFEIKHNLWRKWKHDDSNLNVETLKEEINYLFEDYNIDIDLFN